MKFVIVSFLGSHIQFVSSIS